MIKPARRSIKFVTRLLNIQKVAKVADDWQSKLTATATKKTVAGKDYQVAHQDGAVMLTLKLAFSSSALRASFTSSSPSGGSEPSSSGKLYLHKHHNGCG